MPRSSTEVEGRISTADSRASNWPERLPVKRGQPSAPGDQLGQQRQHLAAVADAEGEGLPPGEEVFEHAPQAVVEEDGARPAGAGAEDVAVAEAAAGGQAGEPGQVGAPVDEVGHGHVHGAAA